MVCPGEWPRLNQGLSHHHRAQVEGLKGPMCKVPKVMTREGCVLESCTHLQHLGDSQVLLEKKGRSDITGLPGPRRRVWNRPPRELVCPRYRLPESEGDRIRRDLSDTTRGDEQPLTSRTICSSAIQVTPDRAHRT